MASTKTNTSIWASETFTASVTHADSASQNVSTDYGGIIAIKVTNGATAPTIQLGLQVEWSPDNSIWFKLGGPFIPGLVNAEDYSISTPYDKSVQYLKIIPYQNNTGQDVTVDANISRTTVI